MKNPSKATIKPILAAINRKGGSYERVYDTDSFIVHYKGTTFYLLEDMTPAVSLLYGNFVANDVYVREILQSADINYGQATNVKSNYQILITKNDYISVMQDSEAVLPQKCTDKQWDSFQRIGHKVLQAFPQAKYLCFELAYASNKHDYYIHNVSFDVNVHCDKSLFKNNESEPFADVFTNLILESADLHSEQAV